MRAGESLGRLTPGEIVYGEADVGSLDIAHGLRAWQRDNGEIILSLEEVWKAKHVVYRLPPQPLTVWGE
jgi:hypothetical protein